MNPSRASATISRPASMFPLPERFPPPALSTTFQTLNKSHKQGFSPLLPPSLLLNILTASSMFPSSTRKQGSLGGRHSSTLMNGFSASMRKPRRNFLLKQTCNLRPVLFLGPSRVAVGGLKRRAWWGLLIGEVGTGRECCLYLATESGVRRRL